MLRADLQTPSIISNLAITFALIRRSDVEIDHNGVQRKE
jgi:hypothetical protein